MDTNDSLKRSLEHFKQQRQKRIEEMLAEILPLDTTIRTIQMQLGETLEDLPSPLSMVQGSLGVETKSAATQVVGGTFKPRADEFFGMAQAEAARAYLERIGHAMSVDDVLKAITSGGCKVGGADPKRTLGITLFQNKRDFINTGGGNWGLRKFYPNMPKLGRPEGTVQPKKKAKLKAKAKHLTKKPAKRSQRPKPEVIVKAYDQAAVVAAVAEVLSDNQSKTPDQIVKAVEKRVGFSVKKLVIYGMLRKKDFEQVGDKYRLRPPVAETVVVQ